MNKRNNKGFSLIEIIVTIAIMAIVVGASTSVYLWTKSARLKETTNGINSAISELRTTTLTKSGEFRLKIYEDSSDNKKYAMIEKKDGAGNWVEYSKDYIGKKPTISCGASMNVSSDNSTGYEIYISFNKADGVFLDAYALKLSDNSQTNIGEIKVNFAGNEKTIKLVLLTGKHYIK